MWTILGVIALSFGLAGCAGLHEPSEHAVVIEKGRWSGEPSPVVQEIDGIDVHNSRPYFLIEATDEIPCEVGERFGFSYQIQDAVTFEMQLTTLWDHPEASIPSTGVDGTRTSYRTSQTIPIRQGGRSKLQYVGWYFSDPADLAEGDWRLSLSSRGTVLLDEVFHVRGCPP